MHLKILRITVKQLKDARARWLCAMLRMSIARHLMTMGVCGFSDENGTGGSNHILMHCFHIMFGITVMDMFELR